MLQGNETQPYAFEQAQQFIQRVDLLAETVGIPETLDDLQQKDFKAIAKEALAEARSSYAVPKTMRKGDVITILESVSTGTRAVSFT